MNAERFDNHSFYSTACETNASARVGQVIEDLAMVSFPSPALQRKSLQQFLSREIEADFGSGPEKHEW
jgi:hypothetical protein